MKKTEIKAVFFDFDMTLVDTGKIGRKVYSEFSKRAKKKPTEEGFDSFMGTRISENISKFAKNKQEEQELHRLFLQIHIEHFSKIKVYGKSILDYLERNRIKAVIISNTSRKIIELICKKVKLHYDFLIADEDMKKTEEKHQAIARAVKKIGLSKKEIIYVGDHLNDIKEGKKAQVRVISVTTGFFSKKQLAKHKPDFIINNLNELKDII